MLFVCLLWEICWKFLRHPVRTPCHSVKLGCFIKEIEMSNFFACCWGDCQEHRKTTFVLTKNIFLIHLVEGWFLEVVMSSIFDTWGPENRYYDRFDRPVRKDFGRIKKRKKELELQKWTKCSKIDQNSSKIDQSGKINFSIVDFWKSSFIKSINWFWALKKLASLCKGIFHQ